MSPCSAAALHVVALELLDETLRAALRADEDERKVAVALELLHERLDLRVRRDGDELVLDLALLALLRQLGLEARRVLRVLARELENLAVERRGEEHRLALARHAPQDLLDLRLEAHVEHPVGLVEDEDADAVERDHAPVDQILEPAGRRDEDVRRLRALRLRAERRAAVDGRDAQLLRCRDRPRSRP